MHKMPQKSQEIWWTLWPVNNNGQKQCYRHSKRKAVMRIGGILYCKLCINKKEQRKRIKNPSEKLLCRYEHPLRNKVMATWLIDDLPLCDDCLERWDTGEFLRKEISYPISLLGTLFK